MQAKKSDKEQENLAGTRCRQEYLFFFASFGISDKDNDELTPLMMDYQEANKVLGKAQKQEHGAACRVGGFEYRQKCLMPQIPLLCIMCQDEDGKVK